MASSRKLRDRFASVEDLPSDLLAKVMRRAPSKDTTPPPANQVKTRFLNFDFSPSPMRDGDPDDVAQNQDSSADPAALASLFVVQGPEQGRRYPLGDTMAQIGRHERRDIQIALGDQSVSRECHASVTYYGAKVGFVVRDGMKPNPILLNGSIMRGESKLNPGDLIQIGQTILRFEEGCAPTT